MTPANLIELYTYVAYSAIVLVPLKVTPNYPFQKQDKVLVVN